MSIQLVYNSVCLLVCLFVRDSSNTTLLSAIKLYGVMKNGLGSVLQGLKSPI